MQCNVIAEWSIRPNKSVYRSCCVQPTFQAVSLCTHNVADAVRSPVNINYHHGETHQSEQICSAGLCLVLLLKERLQAKLTIIDSEDALIVEGDGVHDGLLRSCCRL